MCRVIARPSVSAASFAPAFLLKCTRLRPGVKNHPNDVVLGSLKHRKIKSFFSELLRSTNNCTKPEVAVDRRTLR